MKSSAEAVFEGILDTDLGKILMHILRETREPQVGYLKRNPHQDIIMKLKNIKNKEKIWKADKKVTNIGTAGWLSLY